MQGIRANKISHFLDKSFIARVGALELSAATDLPRAHLRHAPTDPFPDAGGLAHSLEPERDHDPGSAAPGAPENFGDTGAARFGMRGHIARYYCSMISTWRRKPAQKTAPNHEYFRDAHKEAGQSER